MRRIYLLIGCLLAVVGTLAAQRPGTGSLAGSVSDPSGSMVSGAAVLVFARESTIPLRADTDVKGGYRFQNLVPGEYLVDVAAQGFARTGAKAIEIHSNGVATLDIQLELARVNTAVVVTASGTPQSVDEISKSLTLVDPHQPFLEGETSLAGSLRSVPGIRVAQDGGPGSFIKVKTRGLRNEDTSVLIDGWRFRDAAAPQGDATGVLEDLLLVNTDRIEVLRGSGSSLYGSNAIGGAINVRTDTGGGDTHGDIGVEGGSLGMFVGRARVAGSALSDRFRYSAGAAYLNVVNGVDGNDAARNTSGQAYAQYSFSPLTFLSARVFAGDSFLQLNSSPYAAPDANLPETGVIPARPLDPSQLALLQAGKPYQPGDATFIPGPDDPDSRRAGRFAAAAVTWSQRLNRNAGYTLGYSSLYTRRLQRDGPGGVSFQPLFNSSDRAEGRIDTARAQGDIRLGNHNFLTGGYEYERESYTDLSQDENPDPSQRVDATAKVSQGSNTVYLQNQTRLLHDRLQISAAGRIQAFSLNRPEFAGGPPAYQNVIFPAPPSAYTADGSIAYLLFRSGTKVRAHVGNGYRAPSLYERFGSSFFFGFFSPFGDPGLRPDRSIAFDAGVDQWLRGNRVRASATYFYTRLQEVIFFDFSGEINPSTDPYGRYGGYRNTGGGLARGVELSLQAAATRTLDITASYTYTNAQDRQSSVRDMDFFKTFGVSNHMLTLVATQRIGKHVDVSFDLFAASSYPFPFYTNSGPRAFEFAGPVRADLIAGYTLQVSDKRNIRFYGRVDNVLNRTYFEDGFRIPGVTALGGVKYLF